MSLKLTPGFISCYSLINHMRVYRNRKIVVLAVVFAFFLFVATPALSYFRPFPPQPRIKGEQTASSSANLREKKGQLKKEFKERLDQAKLAVCEKLEDRIVSRADRLVDRVNKHTTRFDRISNKVQTFYTEKMVPKGIIVENYNQLVSNIDTKRTAVQGAAGEAASVIKEFDCGGEGPRQILASFHDQMHIVIKALREYRKGVVDLIVAVRTAFNNSNKSNQATSSAD